MIFVGIDISKLTFDVAVLIDGKYMSRQFENKHSVFLKLSRWIKSCKNPAYFCLETTGIYGLALAKHLY
jgi:transposase